MVTESWFLRSSLLCLFLGGLVGGGTIKAQEWEHLGLLNQQLSDIAVQNEDTVFASTYTLYDPGNIFKTTNGGLTWDTTFHSAGTARLVIHPANPSVVYAGLGSVDGPWGILKTTNGGDDWFQADSGLYMYGEYWIRSIEIDPVHPEILYTGTSNGPFSKSTNGGVSWSPIGAGFFNAVNAIVFDPHSPDTMYAGDGPGSGLFKSPDGGATWEGNILPVGGVVNGLGIDPVDGNILYAGIGTAGFFRSTDAGETWEEVTAGLPPNTSGGSIVVNRITREVFGVTFPYDGGVFKSMDLGITWERLGGLPAGTWPIALTISPDQTQLYLGYYNLGVYRTTILVTDVPLDGGPLPTKPALLQNYPNPFNPMTTISYELPVNIHVTLTISDVVGREVARLVDGSQEAGYKSVTFDGSNLASGIYFYRLQARPLDHVLSVGQAGDFVEVRKLILMK